MTNTMKKHVLILTSVAALIPGVASANWFHSDYMYPQYSMTGAGVGTKIESPADIKGNGYRTYSSMTSSIGGNASNTNGADNRRYNDSRDYNNADHWDNDQNKKVVHHSTTTKSSHY